MRGSRCRDCGKPLRWATTARGYRKPFDRDPSPDGQYVLNYEQARFRDRQIVPERWTATWVSAGFRERALELHAMHEETCVPATVKGAA